jgi:NADPH:quinone reductase-like Zn-dependent oxidoreductase
MKAVILHKYGSPDYLEFTEIEKPVPGDKEVLVKVHAASLNSWDWDIMNGTPFVNRLTFGLRKPNKLILGADIAGQVEKVGRKVKHLKPGDEILGDISGSGWGGFAEYVCASAYVLALKPENMSFEEAAAIPQAGLLAFKGLRYKGQLQKGQKVLINGAGGGSGSFAVKFAKSFGAEVTGVDKGSKSDMLLSIGVDHVIDYEQEDFMKEGVLYDLILDVVSYRSMFDYRRILAPGGVYAMLGGGSWSRVFQGMLLGPLISLVERVSAGKAGKKMGIVMVKPNTKELTLCLEALEAGKIAPVIDRRFTLKELPEALRYLGEGLALGKVVITVSNTH